MDSHNNKSAFWPSYVDIMTTLFAIMLVLFAVSYSRFKIKQRELEEFKDKYEEIMAIYKAVDNIDPEYFEFNKEYLKHIFKIQVNYQKGKFSLDNLLQDDPNSAEYNLTEANAILCVQILSISLLSRDKLLPTVITLMITSTMMSSATNELLNCMNSGGIRQKSTSPIWINVSLSLLVVVNMAFPVHLA